MEDIDKNHHMEFDLEVTQPRSRSLSATPRKSKDEILNEQLENESMYLKKKFIELERLDPEKFNHKIKNFCNFMKVEKLRDPV